MIFIDSSALYALTDAGDGRHPEAKAFYADHVHRTPFALTLAVLAETFTLLEHRAGHQPTEPLWEQTAQGLFELLPVTPDDVRDALAIERRYRSAALGFVDSLTLAMCERYRIDRLFTFDRRDFLIYRPKFTKHFELVP
jgi:predicted nucleic acid-binding protein